MPPRSGLWKQPSVSIDDRVTGGLGDRDILIGGIGQHGGDAVARAHLVIAAVVLGA